MLIETMVRDLKQEKDRLDKAIAALESLAGGGVQVAKPVKRMSVKTRAALRRGLHRYWREKRKNEHMSKHMHSVKKGKAA